MRELLKALDQVLTGLEKVSKSAGAESTGSAAAVDGGSSATPATTLAAVKSMAVSTALGDAIDRELVGVSRQTSVGRVRDSEVLDRFRAELESESLTLTTVTSLLQFVRQALQAFSALTT